MRKILIKAFAATIGMSLALSVVGCGKSDSAPTAVRPADLAGQTGAYNGIHRIDVGATDIDFISDGKTEYKVVIPSDENEYIQKACRELNYFFTRSANLNFTVVTDEGLSYHPNDKYISIGETKLLEEAGIALDFDVLGYSGYIIKTMGNSVFLAGTGSYGYGNLYAVYEFLEHTIDYEIYFSDEIVYDTGVENLKLPDFDVLDVPDFEWRVASYRPMSGSVAEADRFRMLGRSDYSGITDGFMGISPGGSVSHTLDSIFPRETTYYDGYGVREGYKEKHPKWLSTEAHQWCFTAHGDDAELQAFVDETVRHIDEDILAKQPSAAIYNLGTADYNSWCECETCLAAKEKYGTDAAVYIQWANRVAEKVETLIEEKYPERRGFLLTIFAYYATEAAPVVSGNGGWEPIDESVVLRDNLGILYAPINANFRYSLGTDLVEDNRYYYETGLKWTACAENMLTWFYSASFKTSYLAPYNSFDSIQDLYRDAKAFNSVWMQDQAQHGQMGATAFNRLKAYLASKLQWQIELDCSVLIDDWFKNYFKVASEPMRRYFDEMRTQLNVIQAIAPELNRNNSDIRSAEYFPKPLLERWMSYIDEAYEAIAPLEQSDAALYRKLYDRICLESISPRYLLLWLYGGRYDEDVEAEMRLTFKSDCIRLNVNQHNESEDMTVVWEGWGI